MMSGGGDESGGGSGGGCGDEMRWEEKDEVV